MSRVLFFMKTLQVGALSHRLSLCSHSGPQLLSLHYPASPNSCFPSRSRNFNTLTLTSASRPETTRRLLSLGSTCDCESLRKWPVTCRQPCPASSVHSQERELGCCSTGLPLPPALPRGRHCAHRMVLQQVASLPPAWEIGLLKTTFCSEISTRYVVTDALLYQARLLERSFETVFRSSTEM